jgi:AcrR family transcriptional regulator
MPPRATDPAGGEKRARILEAALELCQRTGVHAARMDEVAALARVSKGTLYRFFRRKEDLFLATLIGSYQESLAMVDAADEPDADPRERLERLFDGLTRILAAVGPRMNVHYQGWGLVAKVPELQDRLLGFLREFHAERGAAIQRILREGQRSGRFRADADAAALAEGTMALLSGFLYRATFDPGRAGPDQLRRCFDALVRDALLRDEPAPRAGSRG